MLGKINLFQQKKELKMGEFVPKDNVFEFNGTVKGAITGTATRTKYKPSYTCIFMSKFKINFIDSQQNKPLVWFRYVDGIVLIWTQGEGKL